MKNNKKGSIQKDPQYRLLNSRFKISVSEYSRQYRNYIMKEFPTVEMMIKKIIQMPCCREYYLKYPLEMLMRGAIKKLMLNSYEVGVFGYFL